MEMCSSWDLVSPVLALAALAVFLFSVTSVFSAEVFTVALPIIAEYGFAVGVFQHGWLDWAGVPSTGTGTLHSFDTNFFRILVGPFFCKD